MAKRTLYFVSETALARRYSKLPPHRHPEAIDHVWVPKSIIEHTSKMGNQHIVTLPDWFVDKEDL